MSKKQHNPETTYTAEVENPENGEKLSFVGVSQEDVEKQVGDFFDFGLDKDGVYVGDEADS
jgi:hypothetical protein